MKEVDYCKERENERYIHIYIKLYIQKQKKN